jgi:hypothetical protein
MKLFCQNCGNPDPDWTWIDDEGNVLLLCSNCFSNVLVEKMREDLKEEEDKEKDVEYVLV